MSKDPTQLKGFSDWVKALAPITIAIIIMVVIFIGFTVSNKHEVDILNTKGKTAIVQVEDKYKRYSKNPLRYLAMTLPNGEKIKKKVSAHIYANYEMGDSVEICYSGKTVRIDYKTCAN